MPIDRNEININSKGGTELMLERLEKLLPPESIEDFQIIPSRVRNLDETKYRIYWCHDLPDDPESQHLAKEGWKKFHKLVFVSYWQRDQYIARFGIPYSKCTVIRNGIVPIYTTPVIGNLSKFKTIPKQIKLIYHTTPHRGLEILVPVFERLCEFFDNIHLDVFSSFKIYGWEERDQPFQDTFDKIKNHSKMTYHGTVDNETVRKYLADAHIFAYPSIWPETSCLSLIEAMSAGCSCIHSSLAALPETSAGFSYMYDIDEDANRHARNLFENLANQIQWIKQNPNDVGVRNLSAKTYIDAFYNIDNRASEWDQLLISLKNSGLSKELEKPSEPTFSYRTP